MEHPARLKRKEVGVGVVEGESLGLGCHGGDEGVIVGSEARQEVGDDFIIAKRSINSSEFIGQTLDLAEIVGSRHVSLLHGGEINTNLNGSSAH
jgi:hypothetical protein